MPSRRERRQQRAQELAAAERPAVLVAAAAQVRFDAGIQTNLRLGGTEWQNEGWLHYDACPEFRSGVNAVATKLSRANLIGVEVDPVTGELAETATDDADVVEIMSEFFGGQRGQSQALDRFARHLIVAGDSWCLATDRPDMDAATWEILAPSDVTGTSSRIMVNQLDGVPRELDPNNELLIRVWRPHPKRRGEADASTRSLLPVLRELAALSAMVSATVKSRLASAGILWMPDDIQMPMPNTATANDVSQGSGESMNAEGWLDLITEAMSAPIADPDSASAVVPLVAMVKGEKIAQITHMEFGRDLDATIQPLRDACVKRLAVGMDLPPEVLLGLGQANHWTAWTITEEFAKSYLAPLLELIADALTSFYLRPALRARGRNARLFAIGFDLTKLFPRQIEVDNAQAAYDAGLLSEAKYMEALGFSEADLATPQERGRHLVQEMLQRGVAQTVAELADVLAQLYPGLRVNTQYAPPLQPGGTPQVGNAPAPGNRPQPKQITNGTEPTPVASTPAAPKRPPAAPPPAGGTP